MITSWTHHYTSTACEHAIHENRPELHARCRLSCKYAPDGVESCRCPCHTGGDLSELPPPWVDQARDIARELLDVAQRHTGIIPKPLRHRIETDPHLFWLRGEEQPDGQWTPPTREEPDNA